MPADVLHPQVLTLLDDHYKPTFRRRSNYFFSHGQSGINGILFTAN
jgi:hypothetical protein